MERNAGRKKIRTQFWEDEVNYKPHGQSPLCQQDCKESGGDEDKDGGSDHHPGQRHPSRTWFLGNHYIYMYVHFLKEKTVCFWSENSSTCQNTTQVHHMFFGLFFHMEVICHSGLSIQQHLIHDWKFVTDTKNVFPWHPLKPLNRNLEYHCKLTLSVVISMDAFWPQSEIAGTGFLFARRALSSDDAIW